MTIMNSGNDYGKKASHYCLKTDLKTCEQIFKHLIWCNNPINIYIIVISPVHLFASSNERDCSLLQLTVVNSCHITTSSKRNLKLAGSQKQQVCVRKPLYFNTSCMLHQALLLQTTIWLLCVCLLFTLFLFFCTLFICGIYSY